MRGRQDKMPPKKAIRSRDDIDAEFVNSLLEYDPETGDLFWKRRPAGSLHSAGYLTISLGRYAYKAHRLIYLMVNGRWPDGLIDHLDGDGTNNAIKNLREATFSQNAMNRKIRSDNTSGYKGVSFMKKINKWSAYVNIPGDGGTKRHYLGVFNTAEEANQACMKARAELHGAFARNS